jgi:hypothetical protein
MPPPTMMMSGWMVWSWARSADSADFPFSSEAVKGEWDGNQTDWAKGEASGREIALAI